MLTEKGHFAALKLIFNKYLKQRLYIEIQIQNWVKLTPYLNPS